MQRDMYYYHSFMDLVQKDRDLAPTWRLIYYVAALSSRIILIGWSLMMGRKCWQVVHYNTPIWKITSWRIYLPWLERPGDTLPKPFREMSVASTFVGGDSKNRTPTHTFCGSFYQFKEPMTLRSTNTPWTDLVCWGGGVRCRKFMPLFWFVGSVVSLKWGWT